jgi:hypothetical protein
MELSLRSGKFCSALLNLADSPYELAKEAADLCDAFLSEDIALVELSQEYLCLLDQILLPQPRPREDEARIVLMWSHFYLLVLRRSQDKIRQRRQVIVGSRKKSGQDLHQACRLPKEIVKRLQLSDLCLTINEDDLKFHFKLAMAKIDLNDGCLDLADRIAAAANVCKMYDVIIPFETRSTRPGGISKVCKMVKRKLDIWEDEIHQFLA